MDLKTRERKIMLLAIVCAGLALGDKLLLAPISHAWSAWGAQITEQQRAIRKGQALLEQRDRWRERAERAGRMALPEDLSTAENLVLKTIGGWTRTSGFSVLSFKSGRQKRSERRREDELRTLQFSITGRGSMDQIARFLFELETGPLPLFPESIELRPRREGVDILDLIITATGLMASDEKTATKRSDS